MCVALFSYYYFDHRTHIVYRLIKNYTQLQFTVNMHTLYFHGPLFFYSCETMVGSEELFM